MPSTTANKTLVVSELYDKLTVQGEGPFIGTPCTFLRLGGCNLRCGVNGGWKCDSSYTWDATGVNGIKYNMREELKEVSFDHIAKWLSDIHKNSRVRTLIVTGGEPLLQDKQLGEMFHEFRDTQQPWWGGWQIHLETNGTIFPSYSQYDYSHISVSPKLSNSGNSLLLRYKPEVLDRFAAECLNNPGRWPFRSVCFKFVVNSPMDFVEIDAMVNTYRIPHHKVYVMPEGVSTDQIDKNTKEVIEATIRRGYNLTTRLHIQLFGNTRGT